jgi:MarR family 2-MHQ and catechol resistance regulon transcriptional repressor
MEWTMTEQSNVLYTAVTHKFLTIYRHIRRYGRQMQQEGISGRKLSALRFLLEAGPCTVGQLRDYLYVSDSSTSELIARLQEKGLVTRHRSDEDNRVVVVALTPTGSGVAQRTQLGGLSLLRERFKALPAERLAVIDEAMTDIMHLLEIDNGH